MVNFTVYLTKYLTRFLNLTRYGLVGLVLLGGLARTAAPARSADLDSIRQRGKLIVAVKNNLPPLGFQDERGQWRGLEVDIARHLAAEILGNPDAVEFRAVSNQDRLQVVLDGNVDVAIAGLTATPSRARLVDFSDDYYLNGTGAIVRLKTPADERSPFQSLAKAKIAVLKGNTFCQSLSEF